MANKGACDTLYAYEIVEKALDTFNGYIYLQYSTFLPSHVHICASVMSVDTQRYRKACINPSMATLPVA